MQTTQNKPTDNKVSKGSTRKDTHAREPIYFSAQRIRSRFSSSVGQAKRGRTRAGSTRGRPSLALPSRSEEAVSDGVEGWPARAFIVASMRQILDGDGHAPLLAVGQKQFTSRSIFLNRSLKFTWQTSVCGDRTRPPHFVDLSRISCAASLPK